MAAGTYIIYIDSYILILACSFVLAGSLQIRYLLSYAMSTKTGSFILLQTSSSFQLSIRLHWLLAFLISIAPVAPDHIGSR